MNFKPIKIKQLDWSVLSPNVKPQVRKRADFKHDSFYPKDLYTSNTN